MKYHFCTCFDNNYLLYGYTLYQSLLNTGADFVLYIVCLDTAVYDNLKKLSLSHVELIPLAEIEESDPEFASTAETRNRIEYIFTLSPVMPLYILKKYPAIDILTYLDADLYFFTAPEKMYQLLGDRSVLVVEHDFYPDQAENAKLYGRFNMAFQLYRNDEAGLACLAHWRKQCIEWCYDRVEDGKFADQKYLEDWPEKFHAVIAPNDSGAGLAQWNCGKHQFDFSGKTPAVDNHPVIYYHYQGCKLMEMDIVVATSAPYNKYIPNKVSDYFYSVYYQALRNSKRELAERLPSGGLRFIYQFQREKSGQVRQSKLKQFFRKYVAKVPYFFNGMLTWRGRRIAPLIFRLFYYKNMIGK